MPRPPRRVEGGEHLLDGHNRRRICREHGIPYRIEEREFPSREDARDFILRAQLGRRNLSVLAVCYLRGKRYLETKHQGRRPDRTSGHNGQNWASEQLEREYYVSPRTIRRDGKFAEAVDAIAANCDPAGRKWLLSRECRLARSGVIRLSQLAVPQQRAYLAEILAGGRPHFPVKRKTITLPADPPALAARLFVRVGPEGALTVFNLLGELLRPQTDAKDGKGRGFTAGG